MVLKDLLVDIDILEKRGNLPATITSLANDSRQVVSGSCFICISGYRVDGHDYLKEAKQKGATVAVVNQFVDVDMPQIKVADTRFAMAALAHRFYHEPSEQLFLVGITATNGKTSTSFMVDEIFKQAAFERAIIGTVKTEFKGFVNPSILTTPESLTLQRYFSEMKKANVSHCTMEVSSSGLELKRVAMTDFDVVTLNNISHEHIDQHGSFEAYVNFKKSLVLNAKSSAWAILNLDDAVSKSLINQTKANVLTYGYEDNSGDLSVAQLDLSTGMAEMTVSLNRKIETKYGVVLPTTYHLKLNVAGFNSVMNSLVALAVGIVSGVSKQNIETGLANYRGVERRFQIVYDDTYKIVDDHFANAGNIDVTFKTLSLMHYQKIVFVYAIRGNRGVTTNRQNAERIVYWAKKLNIDRVYATLSKKHVTWKDTVSADEIAVFEAVLTEAGLNYSIDDDLTMAINKALKEAKQNDIVLLAGCQGMDCGAHIALNSIYQNDKSIDWQKHYQTIIDRVCCEGETLCEKQ